MTSVLRRSSKGGAGYEEAFPRKCKTGTWEAGVLKTDMGDWGVRCAVLAVRHKETGPDYSVIRQRKVYQMKDGWLE